MYIMWITSFYIIKIIFSCYFIIRHTMISFGDSDTAEESLNL